MHLVIVESPTKARTLQGFLGSKYKVLSSFGHVRDLPAKKLSIDIKNDFKPEYAIIPRSKKIITELKKEIKNKNVILATDEDREGEAIAYHLVQALGLGNSKSESRNPKRIVFHEITKKAIEEALKNPREIDMNLVDAQQARRILDRLVGYKLSPLLWKKVARGLSAGRVQSVTVRLIVERQKEIDDFKHQEYWTIEAEFRDFVAKLAKKNNKTIPKLEIKTKKQAEEIVKDLKGTEYKVIDIEKKETLKNPFPPYTTSTLQQDAVQRLHYSAKQTMMFAQKLYEKGLITYHRTDSLNLSNLFLAKAKKYINKEFGAKYLNIRQFKTKSKGAQEAHEAIRPTNVKHKVDDKLYNLIWQRALASQMSSAVFDAQKVDIEASKYEFRATGQTLKFDGFLRVYPMKTEETILPELKKNEILELIKLIPLRHFTKPPSPYTEATLVKALEEHGIGRPSTYAPTLDTIQKRNYVIKRIRYLHPTDIGILVNNLLVEHFPKIVDTKFTAKMEEDLDKIAHGKEKWVPIIEKFYTPFDKNLKQKDMEIDKKQITEEKSDEICEKCNKPMIIKMGRYGKFLACSGFPECKNTKPIEKLLGVRCSKCIKGEMVERITKKGKIFYGCNQFPKCDFALWNQPINEKCPKCESLLVKDRKNKVRCSNKVCDFVKK